MQRCGSCKESLPLSSFSPALRGKNGFWCRSCTKFRRGQTMNVQHEPQPCNQCGSQYVPKQLKAKSSFCSRKCKDDAKNQRREETARAAKPAIRVCPHCGTKFGRDMRADAIFCSVSCNERAHALQRKYRARTHDGSKMGYIRAMICERDRWRCGICGGKVDQKRQHPDLLCASLDHIVPVAEGGDNAVTNLRLTHLRCNLSRRNRGGNEQLAII